MRRNGSRFGRRSPARRISSGSPAVTPSEIIIFIGDSETAGRATASWALEPTTNAYSDGTALTWDWATSAFVTAADTNSKQALGKSMVKPTCWWRAQAIGGGAVVAGINVGYGGVTTAQWLSGDATTVGYILPGLNLFNTAVTVANQAKALYPSATIRFHMYIGANDATASGYGGAGSVLANCQATIAGLRAGVTGASSAQVIFYKLPNLVPAAPYNTNWNAVNADLVSLENVPSGILMVKAYRGWPFFDFAIHPESMAYEDAAMRSASRMAGNADAFSTVSSPSAISGLVHWNDPSSGRTPSGAGDIDSWVDRQSAVTYTQATAADKPDYVAASANANSQPVIQFADDRLDAAAGNVATHTFLQAGPAMSFIVTYTDPTNSQGHIFTTSPGTATPGVQLERQSTTFTWKIYRAAGTLYAQVASTTPTAAGTFCMMVKFSGAGSLQSRADDKFDTWNGAASYSGSPSSSNHSPPRMGRNSTTNLPFIGELCEELHYNVVPSNYDIMRLRYYLGAKYALETA